MYRSLERSPTRCRTGGTAWYQYVFLRDGERIGAMGFFGPQEFFAGYPHSSWIYTFDLTFGHVVDDMLRFKRTLGSSDDDFQFIRSLAAALVPAAITWQSLISESELALRRYIRSWCATSSPG